MVIINETTQEAMKRIKMLPTFSPISGGLSVTLKNIYFSEPRAIYFLQCLEQSLQDKVIDIPLNLFIVPQSQETQQ
jgi:hypothetical protein